MTKINRIIFLSLVLLILASCSSPVSSINTGSYQDRLAQATQTVVAPKGSMVGRLVSNTQGGKPLANTVIRLAEIYYNADKSASNWVLSGGTSPGVDTDADGYFTFNNIDAREYVMIIGDFNDQYSIMTQADGKHAIIYTIQPGKVLDVQTVKADFPLVKK
jgi:hypothetical protein